MGGQKGVASFYQYLQKHLPVFLALSKNNVLPEPPPVPGYAMLHQNKTVFLNLLHIGFLKKLIRRHHIDLIIAEHSYAGWIALLLKRSNHVPFIIHSHNLEAIRFRHMQRWWWKGYYHYERWIHQKADCNFFISDVDKAYAIRRFRLSPEKCVTITYGAVPSKQIPHQAKHAFLQSHGLKDGTFLLYFNGTMDYEPNYAAVNILIDEIAPRISSRNENFKILISGNRMSPALKQRIQSNAHFILLDYVDNVDLVYQSVQLFLNPMPHASGVKTKAIEAIANQCTVISTASGATGLNKHACGSKLVSVADGDWDGFVKQIVEELAQPFRQTPQEFWACYSWNSITQRAAAAINNVIQQHAAN
jgi:glycosyltransferase involved in cell wall biosynthesis